MTDPALVEAVAGVISDETARYGIDQFMIRVDAVTWGFSVFLAAIVIRMTANPLGFLVDKVSQAGVRIINAWKGR